MIATLLVAGSSLDDFLGGSVSANPTGERVRTFGVIASLLGATLAIGLVAFMAFVHRGSRVEVESLVKASRFAGVLLFTGAAVELAGLSAVLDTTWLDSMTTSGGAAPAMRLVAGVLVALGLYDDVVESDRGVARWAASGASAFGVAGLLLVLVSFSFDGHTVMHDPRIATAAIDAAHVGAGSVWFGGVVGLVVVATLRYRSEEEPVTPFAPLAVRFSSVAAVALLVVAGCGVALCVMITDGWDDLTGTPWGRKLLIKTAGVSLAALIGAYHRFQVVPKLNPEEGVTAARTTLTVEAAVLALVVAVTGFLVMSDIH